MCKAQVKQADLVPAVCRLPATEHDVVAGNIKMSVLCVKV